MELNKYIDHTYLKPFAMESDIIRICDEAKKYHFASVCVNPCNVPLVAKELAGSDVAVCSVVGFPFGTHTTKTKLFKAMCRIVESTHADFIKTSTGYGSRGANFEDIELFKKYLKIPAKMKASGGIRTTEDAKRYVESGCSRLGTSNGVSIMEGTKAQEAY